MPEQASFFQQFVPFIIIFFVFYILILKPQKDQQKQRKVMLSNLKKNDQIVTTSGIYGTIVNVKDKTIIVRVDENVKIEFEKEAVATVLNPKS